MRYIIIYKINDNLMRKIYYNITNKIVDRFFIGSMCFSGLLFFKIREDRRERALKREIYNDIKNGYYKYLG